MHLVKSAKWLVSGLLTCSFILPSKSQAQFYAGANASMYGYGMVPGMEACGGGTEYGRNAADVLYQRDTLNNDLSKMRSDLIKARGELRDANKKRRAADRILKEIFIDEAYTDITQHMEGGFICSEVPSQGTVMNDSQIPAINQQMAELYVYLFGDNEAEQDADAESAPRPSRAPAGEDKALAQTVVPAAEPAAPTPAEPNPQHGTAGGRDSTTTVNKGVCVSGQSGIWKNGCGENSSGLPLSPIKDPTICMLNGLVNERICVYEGITKKRDPAKCRKAIKDYRAGRQDEQKLEAQVEQLKSDIDELRSQMKDIPSDLREAMRLDSETEAYCEDGSCYGRAKKEDSNFPWRELLGVGMAAGFGYLGYRGYMNAVDSAKQLGYAVSPQTALGYSLPFAFAGMYGALAGSMGCAGTLGGVNPLLFGGLPLALAGGLGANVGGGMFMPGMGYIGMPFYGGGLMGGLAGGLIGGIAGGIAGGLMPGMFPGMAIGGLAGGIAGGIAGGMMPFYGLPGMAIGGLAGGIAGGAIGLASPFYGIPGMAGGGIAGGIVGGMPGMGMEYQQMMMQMQMQQYQSMMQMQMQQMANQQARMRTIMSLQYEMQSLQVRLQQAYTGVGGFGYGGIGGGISFGVNAGLGIGGGGGYYPGGMPLPPHDYGFPSPTGYTLPGYGQAR